jgi:hypothetical protein
MDLFEQTIASEVARAFPYMGPGGPCLTNLHSKNGFRMFGFSLHTLETHSRHANVVVVAFDFSENPQLSESLPQPMSGLRTLTLPIRNGQRHIVLTAEKRYDYAFAICVSEAEEEDFVHVMRWARRDIEIPEFWSWQPAFRIDEQTNKIIGAMSYASALRSFYAAKVLRKHWSDHFEGSCPTELSLGLVRYTEGLPFRRPDGEMVHLPSEQAVKHPALARLSPEWSELGVLISGVREGEPKRVADWEPTDNDLAHSDGLLRVFCENVFQMLHIAHRCLGASFTCEFGSSLTTSNVDAEGWVHDLETFSMPQSMTVNQDSEERVIFGDDVSQQDQLEDLTLAIELVLCICGKLGIVDRRSYLDLAYRKYAQAKDTGPMPSSLDLSSPSSVARAFAETSPNWGA